MDLGYMIVRDYVRHGAHALKDILARDPDAIHLIPMALARLQKEFPLMEPNFRVDFAEELREMEGPVEDDVIDHPSHYTQGGIECIDAMEACLPRDQFIGYLRGCIFKYQWRLGCKDDIVQDARKMGWYQQKLVSTLTTGR